MGRKPQVTREEVLCACREAFALRGYHGTSLASIASRLGITAAALLRHAPTKEGLFAAAMSSGESEESLPMDFLSGADLSQNPRKVLKRLADAFVPFVESKIAENIARWMHAKTEDEARTIRLPFDPRTRPTPPQRGLALLENYLRKASRAGKIRVRNPRAAALAFLGSLHSYVFLHRVLRIVDPPVPLDVYLNTVLDIWSFGAIRSKKRRS